VGLREGENDGSEEGISVGAKDGAVDGSIVGANVGLLEGANVGDCVGTLEGVIDGELEGSCVVGAMLGVSVGFADGIGTGSAVGVLGFPSKKSSSLMAVQVSGFCKDGISLPSILKSCIPIKASQDSGIVPVMSLLDRSRNANSVKLPHSSGTDPAN